MDKWGSDFFFLKSTLRLRRSWHVWMHFNDQLNVENTNSCFIFMPHFVFIITTFQVLFNFSDKSFRYFSPKWNINLTVFMTDKHDVSVVIIFLFQIVCVTSLCSHSDSVSFLLFFYPAGLCHHRRVPVVAIWASRTVQCPAPTLHRALPLGTYNPFPTSNHPATTNTNRYNKVKDI